jgi:hypothetical protein
MIAILTDTPAKDRMVQEAFFSKNWGWVYVGKKLEPFDTKWPYKFISDKSRQTFDGGSDGYFRDKNPTYISTEEFLENIDGYLEEKVIDNSR